MIRKPAYLFQQLGERLRDCKSILELGCMFGAQLSYVSHAEELVGVEIHAPYLERAEQEHPGPLYVNADARTWIKECQDGRFEGIMMIDFLEHLEMEDALDIIVECKRVASKKIIAFVPYGNHPQTIDPYQMGADYHQTHKATWHDHNLSNLGFETEVWDKFHEVNGKDDRAIFGIWTRP